jgi:trafficking protein particle complex subunit 8
MILAGHRFGKSGQKRHASRAYQLALQVYKGHGWSLAEDHIHYTIGRQCLSGQQIEAACQALAALLKPHSMQTPSQQSAYLNEFIHVHQMMSRQSQSEVVSKNATTPILPLPLVDSRNIKTLVETKDPGGANTPAQTPVTGITEASHVTFGDDEAHHPR